MSYASLIACAHESLTAAREMCPNRVLVNRDYIIGELERTMIAIDAGTDILVDEDTKEDPEDLEEYMDQVQSSHLMPCAII